MRFFSNRTMVQKICIISMACLTIPTLFFSFYLYQKQSNDFREQLIHEQRIAIEQTTDSLDNIFYSIAELAQDMGYSDSLSRYLSRQYRTGLEKYPIWSEKTLNTIVASIKYSLKYRNLGINAANVFSVNAWKQEGNYFWSADRLSDLDFFEDFQKSEKESSLYYLSEKETEYFRRVCGYSSGSADKNIILVIQKINEKYLGPCVGYVIFECSPAKIFPSLFTHSQTEHYFAWFHDSRKGFGAALPESPGKYIDLNQDSPFPVEINHQQYICCTMKHFNITIMNTQPFPSRVNSGSAFSLSLALALFALIQFGLLTLFIRKSFQQLHTDLNLMDAIIAHGFHERIPEIRTDEIGMIAHRYNILLDKINSLIQETVQKETAQTQAQLKALQYQINPHFIYNTLSIFSGYASQNGLDTLSESIASFGQLLRYNIKNDGLHATIDSELRTAVSLINVYNIRYFNQLTLVIDVPDSVRKIQIIKFLLQPLLENSILHGLVPPNTSLNILISIKQVPSFMEIQISDDGEGMSPERLAEVQNCLENPTAKLPDSSSSTFIGLQNINKRLKLFYSQKAQLMIESKEHCGTAIMIRIPTNSLKE